MKKLHLLISNISCFALLCFALLVSNTNKTEAQCPTGYDFFTLTFQYAVDCEIYVEYCLWTGITITGGPRILIQYAEMRGPCSGIPLTSEGYKPLPISIVLKAILDEHGGDEEYFPWWIIPECGQTAPMEILTNGACYEISWDEYMTRRSFVPCSNEIEEGCVAFWGVCREFINNEWKLKLVQGPPNPTFECDDEDCYPQCGL